MDFTRDRWGRPLIKQPEGKDLPYTRISGYGQVLEDQFGLTKWKQRMVLVGAVARPDLVKLATASKDDDRRLDTLVEQMLEAGGASRAANTGTAIHEVLANLDTGKIDLDSVPDEFLAHARLWTSTLRQHGLTVEQSLVECQLVNDRFQAAGSGDNFLRDSNGVLYVADKKTGKSIGKRPLAYMVQLALYATADLYDIETGERTPIGCNQNTGYIVHLPANGETCDLYEVDLDAALELATLAQQVRQAQKLARPISRVGEVVIPAKSKPISEKPAKSAKPTVAERRTWIADRVRTILEQPDGRAMLQLCWPEDIPRLSSGHKHTAAQLDRLTVALDEAERGSSAPFPAPDPANIAKPVVEAKGEPRKAQPKPLDEGRFVDQATIDALRAKFDSLLHEQREQISTWAKEAHAADRNISLQLKPSERRFNIARAMFELATVWEGDSDAVQAVIRTVTPLDTTVGATLGSLTIDQAESLIVHSDALAKYGTLSYTFDGVAEFQNTKEALETQKESNQWTSS